MPLSLPPASSVGVSAGELGLVRPTEDCATGDALMTVFPALSAHRDFVYEQISAEEFRNADTEPVSTPVFSAKKLAQGKRSADHTPPSRPPSGRPTKKVS